MSFFKLKSKFFRWLCLGLGGILSILIGHFTLVPAVATQGKFESKPLVLNSYDLYDLGVTDVNNDDKLDIFTANHSALSSLAINQGNNTFVDRFIDYGMSQDRNFPALEVSNRKYQNNKSGLAIYRQNRFRWSDRESDNQLVIAAKKLEDNTPIEGKITLDSAVKILKQQNFQVEVTENQISANTVETIINFSTQGDGKLVLETDLTALETKFTIAQNIPLDRIYLGAAKIQPDDRDFQLHWRDRHGTAWADFNGDGTVDAFITRGGLKGKLEDISARASDNFLTDELFSKTSDATQLQDIATKSGLEKKDCPGRQTAWVDFDRDEKLDLYIVCGRGVPPLGNSPNQLYQQGRNSQFVNVAADLGLAFPEQGTFAWLDTDNDKSIDLLWATRDSFQIWRDRQGKFQLAKEIPHNLGRVKKLSSADYDADGDSDILALGAGKSLLLKNENSNFTFIKPDSIGLPAKSLTANWVDFDNDGKIDLHAIPGGIFTQTDNGRFQATGLLQHNTRISKLVDAKSSWFDVNNDGRRDLLFALNYRPWWLRILGYFPKTNIPDSRNSEVGLYLNQTDSKNNWLELKLVGTNHNPQAIGATVTIPSQSSDRLIRVGQAEGSHFSQGHYRIYLGLGKLKTVEPIRVTWSNGETEEFKNLRANHLEKIVRGSGSPVT